MDTEQIKQMLDQLAEFEAQRDLIELNKRKLLDEVTIPAEIEAIARDGMARANAVNSDFTPQVNVLHDEVKKKLAEIVIPDEVRALIDEIERQRALVLAYQDAKLAEYREHSQARRAEIMAEVEAATRDVFRQAALRKQEIEIEFSGQANAVNDNIAKLTAQIKEAAKQVKETVKGSSYMAVYVKGRVTWDTTGLDKYVVNHPEVDYFRKEGDPSITLRRI